MESIKIQSYRSTIIIAILLFLLSALILYWGLSDEIKLRVSGAKLDHFTSKILLIIISIFPFVRGINYLIKYISVLRYGEFIIKINNNTISYPEDVFFRGFKSVTIEKQQIKFVEIEKIGQHNFRINLINEVNKKIGSISGELLSKKTIGINELAEKIYLWLKI